VVCGAAAAAAADCPSAGSAARVSLISACRRLRDSASHCPLDWALAVHLTDRWHQPPPPAYELNSC